VHVDSIAPAVPSAPATRPEPTLVTLQVELGKLEPVLATPALAAQDWSHAVGFVAAADRGKAASSVQKHVRVDSLEQRITVGRAPQAPLQLWLALDGFAPRKLDARSGRTAIALRELLPELTKLAPSVHRLTWFVCDGQGRMLTAEQGAPLAGGLNFEFAPPGAVPIGAAKFAEREQRPFLFSPRGTINGANGVVLQLWSEDPELSYLLHIEGPQRAQAFLKLSRGSYQLTGLPSGDYLFSLAREGASEADDWTITINTELELPLPATTTAVRKGQ
jgi:hypothetical protein